MKRKALSLKVWVGLILLFVAFQFVIRLYFEEKIFYQRDLKSLSDGHFFRLENNFNNTKSGILKVAVFGSSRVAKGIECPDAIHTMLLEKGQQPIQLNKIWESFDPFELFVEDKEFLKRLIPLQPDLICIQAEMLAIQMPTTFDQKRMQLDEKYKKIWNLKYNGNTERYIPKEIKYQSKVNQELVHRIVVGSPYFQGQGPCNIHDNYANIDTLEYKRATPIIKKWEDIQYISDDLELLKKAGIKVVIIETPFPNRVEKNIKTPEFRKKLNSKKEEFKNRFDIDYWEYTGPPLHYKHYADGGHLNPEGRSIYTEWLVAKIQKETPTY
ncbi:MAG: SGNH/GDSL hydrolase family protein [Saprospiraceae bacterium]|nr:SGNH/GDSL hydrolase family protein [Saprospiraceae bacterium]